MDPQEFDDFPETPSSMGDGFVPDRAGSILASFDWTDIIEELQHRLRREQLKGVGNKRAWAEPPYGVFPLLNDRGIEDVLALLTSVVQRVTALSSVPKNERPRIYLLLEQIGQRLIMLLAKNYADYEIKGPSHILLIYETIINPMEFAMRYSVDGSGHNIIVRSLGENRQVLVHEDNKS